MDNRPIGVFDSGLGGLTAVKELRRLLPNEKIIYFGDTGRVPYGSRSRETIAKYARQDIGLLLKFDVKMIVCACGTVSSVLGDGSGENLPVPFVRVLVPAAQAACALSSNSKIGVIGTTATIRSGEFGRIIRSIRPDARVYGNACPLLVPIVENGLISKDNPIAVEAVRMYLEPLKKEGIDTLVLGCTHYPLLYDIINQYLNYEVTLIDSGREAARSVRSSLAASDMLCDPEQEGDCQFYVSDAIDGFVQTAELFLGDTISQQVHRVDIDTL